MSQSGDDKSKYRSVHPDTAPKNEEGQALVDLYVHLPTNKKFVKWVHKGDQLDSSYVEKIKDHVDPNFYAEEEIEESKDRLSNGALTQNEFNDKPEDQKDEVKIFRGSKQEYQSARIVINQKKKDNEANDERSLGQIHHLEGIKNLFGSEKPEILAEPIDDALRDVYRDIEGAKPGNFTIQDSKLELISEKICSIISPEVGDVRNHLKNIPAFVRIMDESSAISTLAILFAVAQGQKTRGVFKDLSYACLLMDISLVGAPEGIKERWVADPDSLSESEKQIIENHPRKSQAIVMEKFKNLPEIVGQMILGHHELFNGRGFPRKVRSDLLAPVVRVLAFAVDVHYHMKKAELDGQIIEVELIIESFMDPKTEPHLRRHNIEMCRKILKYCIEGDGE